MIIPDIYMSEKVAFVERSKTVASFANSVVCAFISAFKSVIAAPPSAALPTAFAFCASALGKSPIFAALAVSTRRT